MKRIKVISERREPNSDDIHSTCFKRGIVSDREMSLEDTNDLIILAVIERNEEYLRSNREADYRITYLSYKDSSYYVDF